MANNQAQVNNFYHDIASCIADFLKGEQHNYLEIVLPYSYTDALPFLWSDFKIGIKYTYYLDLTLDTDQLLENMSTQRRKNIRDASKQALEVRQISDPQIVYSKAFETLSSKKAKFNEQIVKQLSALTAKESLTTVGIYKDHDLLALSSCLTLGNESTYMFGWNSGEKGQSFLGTFALWNCILLCKEKSQQFNFAGSQIPSIEKFFRGFGGELTPLISITSDKRKLSKRLS
ncbi:peptidoglycan bridge formation glycyltransferase FemA/FemB family protein [Parvicella tangerina]|nr:peptidoglycan bridge formation glycyltransferase FemA/FemB family protein [Parvicella tangerina]